MILNALKYNNTLIHFDNKTSTCIDDLSSYTTKSVTHTGNESTPITYL